MLHLLYRLSLWLLKGLDYFSGSIERHPFFFFTPMDFFHHLSQTTPSGFYIDPFRSIQTQTLIIDVERPKRRQPRRRGRGKGFRRSATPLWYKSNEQPSIASRLLPLDFCTLPVSSYSDRTSSPPFWHETSVCMYSVCPMLTFCEKSIDVYATTFRVREKQSQKEQRRMDRRFSVCQQTRESTHRQYIHHKEET